MLARVLLLVLSLVFAAFRPPEGIAAAARYSVTAHLAGAGGAWDDAVIDEGSGRLYLAQAGVTAVDLKTQTVTTGLVAAKMSHGVAALGDGTIAVDDSQSKVITVFDGVSGRVVSKITTADDNPVSGIHALDALVFEPRSGWLIAINGESGLLLLIDVKHSRVVGTMHVGGHPEFAAADGTGRIFVNVNHGKRSELLAVDIALRSVVGRFALSGCEGATGLAYDKAAKLVLSVCDNGFLKVFDEHSHRVVSSIAVGRGADAVMFDPARRRAFIASGDDATLSVIAVRDANDIALEQTLSTQIGTRSGAVDIDSGRVYLPSAKFGPPKPPIPYPSVLPGTFEFLVAAPQ